VTPVRSRKIGQVALAERDLQIAALGDFDRVLERFGKVGEKRDHLLGGLEILLFGVQARTPGVAEHVALGNTDARFVRLEVVAFEKLDRMRGHQRQLQLGRKIGGRRHQELLLRLPVALHFEIESVREELLPTPRAQRRLLEPALQQRFTDIAGSGARKRDQTIDAHLLQHAPAELGTSTHARRQVGTRQQLAQLPVALPRANQQQQSIRTIGIAFVGNEDIAAEQRLDSLATCRRVELDQTEDIRQIGERQSRHAVAACASKRITETDDAVGNRILTVQAKMDERGFRHPAILRRRGTQTVTTWRDTPDHENHGRDRAHADALRGSRSAAAAA
jgi:hypothetical protein